jgi:hypothetical protein
MKAVAASIMAEHRAAPAIRKLYAQRLAEIVMGATIQAVKAEEEARAEAITEKL